MKFLVACQAILGCATTASHMLPKHQKQPSKSLNMCVNAINFNYFYFYACLLINVFNKCCIYYGAVNFKWLRICKFQLRSFYVALAENANVAEHLAVRNAVIKSLTASRRALLHSVEQHEIQNATALRTFSTLQTLLSQNLQNNSVEFKNFNFKYFK